MAYVVSVRLPAKSERPNNRSRSRSDPQRSRTRNRKRVRPTSLSRRRSLALIRSPASAPTDHLHPAPLRVFPAPLRVFTTAYIVTIFVDPSDPAGSTGVQTQVVTYTASFTSTGSNGVGSVILQTLTSPVVVTRTVRPTAGALQNAAKPRVRGSGMEMVKMGLLAVGLGLGGMWVAL